MSDDFDSDLTTSLEPDGDRPRLVVRGEIDLYTAPRFREALDAAVAPTGNALVDLREVGFMDSTGLRALLEVRRGLEPDGGTVSLRLDPSGPVARLLDLAGVDGLFERLEEPSEQG